MKKLSIALALLLCVVLCVFCFASCGKKKAAATTVDQGTTPAGTTAPGTTAPDTTAEPTLPPHEHTPEADYTIDKPATCGEDGQKSIHCSECGNIIPGTEVKIDKDPTLHVVDDWTIVPATVIKDGSKTGTCTVCHQPVEETIAFVPKIYDASSAANAWKIKKNLTNALDGKHFYPTDENPNGLDYYFEVDFLWNETITTNWIDGDGMRIELVNADSTRDNLFLLVPKNDKWDSSDAKASGGFDYGWVANHTIVYGPMGVNGTGTNAENFPNIGEYGWHRIGVKVHQAAAIKGDGVEYSMITTLYLDGVKAWQITFDQNNGKDFSKWLDKGLMLFTATNEEGVLAYADPSADLCLDFSAYHSEEMNGLFMVTGEAVSCAVDPDFTPEGAVPVADPEAATLTVAEGVELPAKIYFKDPASGHDHVWTGPVDITKQATLLEDGVKTEHCAVCNESREVPYSFEPDIQKFTDATTKSYNPNIAKVSDIRGEEHFYTAGNDLLVEYSVLWTEEIKDLKNDQGPYMDFRFTQTSNPDTTNKNIFYWSLSDNCKGSDCKFAGGFEWGGIDQNEPDNPYPKFTDGALGLGETRDEYPNIGGANKGDGIPQGEDRYGWHRVSVRYRQEVANVDAVKAGAAAEYKLSLWAYIDGVLVVHAYATDFIYRPGKSDQKDYKLYTAASDGNGGIAYTESGDDLYFSGAYFHYKQMASGKVAYFAIADYSAKIGSEFEQNVAQVNYPVAKQLEVEDGVFVPVTMWYTKACAEHTWDGEFTLVEEATLLNDGLKVEHCSVCGMSHEVAVEAAPVITDSKNIAASPYADNSNKDLAILKSVANIRGEDHFYPDSTEIGAQGNDLWFEYSFLYNDSLQYRDAAEHLAEMRLFGFRSADYSKYRGFYYIYFLNDDGKGGAFNTSGDCPWAGHIDFSTYDTTYSPGQNCADDLTSLGNKLNGKTIGRYIAGWGAGRDDSPYLWDAEYQTMGGWHRLGFRYHQEVASVEGNKVTYAGYTELYIDGVLCWRVHTNFSDTHNDGLGKKGLLLWTATAADGVITGYTENDTMLVGTRIDRLDTSSQSVYVGIDDPQWNCGDGFVHPVVRVEEPKPTKITLPDGNDYDGAMYFTYAHDHVWDEDYEVVKEATLLEDGIRIDHCSICGETRETDYAEEPIVYLTNWNAAERAASPYSIDNPDDHKDTFGFKEAIKDVRGDDHYYGGNDLLIEFSFLYNATMANASHDGTLAVMYIENNNLFNVNVKTGKITAAERSGDVYVYPTPEAIALDSSVKTVDIGEYGWHRFAVRIHQDAVNNGGEVEYTVIATAYLDGAKIIEIDKTAYALSKHNGSSGYTGLLYTATIEDDNVVCADLPENKYCDVYVMVECIYANEDDANAGYVVVADVDITCGADFVEDVSAVADPAADTLEVADGVELPAAIYYEYAG